MLKFCFYSNAYTTEILIVICTTSYESHTFFHEFAEFAYVLYTLFFCISKKLEKFGLKGL
jgi:hypothetical protein